MNGSRQMCGRRAGSLPRGCARAAPPASHAQKVDVVVGVEARQLLGRGRVRLVNLQPAVQPVREDQVVRQPAEESGGGARGWLRPTAPPGCCAAAHGGPGEQSDAALLAATKSSWRAAPHALEPHGLHRVPRPVVVVAHIRAVVIGDAPLRRHGGGAAAGGSGAKEAGAERQCAEDGRRPRTSYTQRRAQDERTIKNQ